MSGPYDDIISLPHPTSSRHPRMLISDRAAQFSPFAALAGHSAALAETARLTDRQIELSDDDKAVLDQKQRILLEHIKECPEITVAEYVLALLRKHPTTNLQRQLADDAPSR